MEGQVRKWPVLPRKWCPFSYVSQESIVFKAFWIVWYYDSLIPALLLQLFYSLVRRRIFPYPTLEELRGRRQDMQRADDFGNLVSSRLTASSSLGIKEMWRLFKVVNKGKRTKIKKVFSQPQSGLVDRDDDTTCLDDDVETKEERDLKRLGLQLLTGLVDLHERIKKLHALSCSRHSMRSSLLVASLFGADPKPLGFLRRYVAMLLALVKTNPLV